MPDEPEVTGLLALMLLVESRRATRATPDGDVVLLSGEKRAPYERPPLSKGYLLGREPAEKSLVHEPEWYAANAVELRLETWASAINGRSFDT